MIGKGYQLFRMFGIPVRVDWSWLLVVVLISWSLASMFFPQNYPGLSSATYWTMGVSSALGLFACILIHELSHSLVARRYGVPIQAIKLFIFGGVAEMTKEPPNAKVEFLIAIAGPLASLVLAGLLYAAGVMLRLASGPPAVTGVLLYLGLINAVLVGFNILPAFPLDGGRVFRAILWSLSGNLRSATQITSAMGNGLGLLLVMFGLLIIMQGQFVGGLWMLLIGMFLRGAAQMSLQQVLIRRALEGETIDHFMQPNVITVPPTLPIQQLVDDYVYQYHHKLFPVVEGSRLLGCVTIGRVKLVEREAWGHRTAGEIMEPCSEANTVASGADAMQTLAQMSRSQSSRMMVVRNEQLVGVVALKDLLRFIELKIELEQ